MLEGDMTLVSELGALKLAVQAAVADAFKTPEVIASFAKREPAALRNRLARLHEDFKLGRIPNSNTYKSQAVEVIIALKKLGETLTPEEKAFLDGASGELKKQFEAADKAIGESAVLSMAAASAKR
jgi:Beta-catenin-interacting protein ICAT